MSRPASTSDLTVSDPFALAVEETEAALGTDVGGLSSDEAAA